MNTDEQFWADFSLALKTMSSELNELTHKTPRMQLIDYLRMDGLNDTAILDTVYPLDDHHCRELIDKLSKRTTP